MKSIILLYLFLFYITLSLCSKYTYLWGDPKTELHLASYAGDVEHVKKLLTEDKIPVDHVLIEINERKSREQALSCRSCKYNLNVDNGTTSLHWAAKGEQLDVIKLLIEHGADINKQRNDGWFFKKIGFFFLSNISFIFKLEKRTALHYVANNGNEEIAKYLLEKGANPNIAMKETNSYPLHFAGFFL